ALLAGDIDGMTNLDEQRDRLPELEAAGFQADLVEILSVTPILFKTDQPPFDDIRVRQAVAHAIDKEAMAEALHAGYATPVGTWARPIEPWYDPSFDPYPFDQER